MSDRWATALDAATEAPCGSISVCLVREDGGIIAVSWAITNDSAARAVAMIRDQLGEPLTEALAGAAQAEGFRDAASAAIGQHAISTMAATGEAGA